MRFILHRLGHGVLLLLGVSVLSFLLFELAPGDYLDELKMNPQVSTETLHGLREQYGLDRPLPHRYLRWAVSTVRGELGHSLAYGMPVSELIGKRVGNTILLSAAALAIAWSLAVPLGVWCAARLGSWPDRAAGGFASVLVTLPDLLVGLLCVATALRFGLAVQGSLAVAALALAAVSFPAVFRHTRSSVAQALGMPFIEHLRACGIAERRILFRHALPAAMNPLITLAGLSLASMTSSSLVIEVILGWPGLGPLLLEAILGRDVHVVLAAVLISSVLLLAANFAADLLLYAADPRIRTEL